jgi:hypothetical protein
MRRRPFVGIRLLLLQHINPLPAELLELLRAHAVIRKETALVAARADVVDEQGAGGRWVRGGVEAAAEGFEEAGDVAVEIADFAGDGAYQFGLVGGEVDEGLRAFGVLDLWVLLAIARDGTGKEDAADQLVSEFAVHGRVLTRKRRQNFRCYCCWILMRLMNRGGRVCQ